MAFQLSRSGSFVFGDGVSRDLRGTSGNDVMIGSALGESFNGGGGNDLMIGGAGADIFAFQRPHAGGDYAVIADFRSGEDHLSFGGLSPKEISSRDTVFGLEINYGGLGGHSPTHGTVLLLGVHSIQGFDLFLT